MILRQRIKRPLFKGIVPVAIGEKEGIRRKPAPDTVYEALKELGKTKEEAVYVGDSDVDLETAKNSGMPCISVLWGFRDKEFFGRAWGRALCKDRRGCAAVCRRNVEVWQIVQ